MPGGGVSKLLFENIKKRFFRVVSNQKSKKKLGKNEKSENEKLNN
jgi:hypothetical protein